MVQKVRANIYTGGFLSELFVDLFESAYYEVPIILEVLAFEVSQTLWTYVPC